MTLNLSEVSVVYPYRTSPVVDRLNLTVKEGEFLSLIGPSGCGKSTILSLLGGFRLPTRGFAACNGEIIKGPGVDRGIVLQDPTLFAWRTVAKNIAFGLEMKGAGRESIEAVVNEMIHAVKLVGWEAAYPHELSGGMKQRVALARALAPAPPTLLLDEPFGALDAQTRYQMQELLISLWEKDRKTVVLATHDIDEAILLSDRVIVLSAYPARVVREFDIDLPRPRKPEISLPDDLISIKRQIYQLLRERS